MSDALRKAGIATWNIGTYRDIGAAIDYCARSLTSTD